MESDKRRVANILHKKRKELLAGQPAGISNSLEYRPVVL